MKVYFYSFSKRKKSTKQVTGSGLEKDVCWKEKTSIIKPSLITSFNPVGYNCVYIPGFSRYYFVSDIHTDTAGTFQIDLTEDELASHKTTIGSTSASILYATGSTKSVVDKRIPIKSTILRGHENAVVGGGSTIILDSPANILGITGKGSMGCYLIQYSDKMAELLDGVDMYLSGVTDVLDIGKQLFFGGTAGECLKSVVGIPFLLDQTVISDGVAVPLYLGAYPCKDNNGNAINGFKITKPVCTFDCDITIPWQSNDWKKVSEYTTITIYLPLVGMYNLPATELQNDAELSIRYALNVTSGDISVQVKGKTSGKIVCMASGNCAVPVAFGSTGINTGKLTSGVAMGVGAAATLIGGIATGGIGLAAGVAIGGTLAGSVGAIFGAMGGVGQGSAGMGGGASYGLDKAIHLWVTQFELTDSQNNFNPIIGKPYMGVATVGSFSGFVQTDGFQLAGGDVYDEERVNINQMLDTGIYYE